MAGKVQRWIEILVHRFGYYSSLWKLWKDIRKMILRIWLPYSTDSANVARIWYPMNVVKKLHGQSCKISSESSEDWCHLCVFGKPYGKLKKTWLISEVSEILQENLPNLWKFCKCFTRIPSEDTQPNLGVPYTSEAPKTHLNWFSAHFENNFANLSQSQLKHSEVDLI